MRHLSLDVGNVSVDIHGEAKLAHAEAAVDLIERRKRRKQNRSMQRNDSLDPYHKQKESSHFPMSAHQKANATRR